MNNARSFYSYFSNGSILPHIKPFFIKSNYPQLQAAAWRILADNGYLSFNVPSAFNGRGYKGVQSVKTFVSGFKMVFSKCPNSSLPVIRFLEEQDACSTTGFAHISSIQGLKDHLGWVNDKTTAKVFPKEGSYNTNFRGQWSPNDTYEKGDIVVDLNGDWHICLTKGQAFDAKFEHFASKGPNTNPKFVDVAKIAADHAIDTFSYAIKPTVNKDSEMKKGIKPRSGNRLVFTYTNGKTFTVRGLVYAEVVGMSIHYKTSTTDAGGNTTKQEVTRRITNDFSTVVIEYSKGSRNTLLDLRSEGTKDTSKPTRTKKSREEWEALEAQRVAEEEKKAKVEQLLSEAEKLLGK